MLSKRILWEEAHSCLAATRRGLLTGDAATPHPPGDAELCVLAVGSLCTRSCAGCKLGQFYKLLISIPRDCSHFRKPWERKSFIRDNFIHLLNLICCAVNRPLSTSGLEWLPRAQARGSRQPDPCCELLSCVRTEMTCSACRGL